MLEQFSAFLIQYGYLGLFLATFLAGSFLPFCSEIVVVGLIAVGLNPWLVLLVAILGNTSGGITSYGIGRLGKPEWFVRYLHVSPKRLNQAETFVKGKGAIMGLFTFLPFIGTAIAIVLGTMRANIPITFSSFTFGQFLRYSIVIATALGIMTI